MPKFVNKNRKIMKSLLKTVILCGENQFPLRGQRDDGVNNPNLPTKQLSMDLLAFRIDSGDQARKVHLKNASRNAFYISKIIKNNEMITTVEIYITSNTLAEIKAS